MDQRSDDGRMLRGKSPLAGSKNGRVVFTAKIPGKTAVTALHRLKFQKTSRRRTRCEHAIRHGNEGRTILGHESRNKPRNIFVGNIKNPALRPENSERALHDQPVQSRRRDTLGKSRTNSVQEIENMIFLGPQEFQLCLETIRAAGKPCCKSTKKDRQG